MSARVRVLVVDDSSMMRMMLSRLLAADPDIEVVGTAADPYVARELLVAHKPDVMTLDLEMPRMDGLTFLEKVMAHLPTRTVIVSGHSAAGSEAALRALELGAIDVVEKPKVDPQASLAAMGAELVARVKAAAKARLPTTRAAATQPAHKVIAATFDRRTARSVVAVASSTGGTEALKVFLKGLPPNPPAIVIVQHMPPLFTKAYADQLARLVSFPVAEACDKEVVQPGRALLAPGNFHMTLERFGANLRVRLSQEPLLHGVRPAADYLLKSVARLAGADAIGVVLTGMGRDGADGLLAMRQAGALTIAQDEATCVVYGMPKAAVELGAASSIAALEDIAGLVVRHLHRPAA